MDEALAACERGDGSLARLAEALRYAPVSFETRARVAALLDGAGAEPGPEADEIAARLEFGSAPQLRPPSPPPPDQQQPPPLALAEEREPAAVDSIPLREPPAPGTVVRARLERTRRGLRYAYRLLLEGVETDEGQVVMQPPPEHPHGVFLLGARRAKASVSPKLYVWTDDASRATEAKLRAASSTAPYQLDGGEAAVRFVEGADKVWRATCALPAGEPLDPPFSAASVVLQSRDPQWNSWEECYALRFEGRGRVRDPSRKNLMLVQTHPPPALDDADRVVLQIGKMGDDVFSVDFRAPLTPLAAWAVALTAMDAS